MEDAKTCLRCGKTKPLGEFYPRKDGTGKGRMAHCKACQKEQRDRDKHKTRARAWYLRNREEQLKRQAERYRSDPEFAERKKQASRKRRESLDPDEWRQYWREWARRNRHKTRATAQARRARLLALPSENVDLRSIGERHGWRCHICGEPILKMNGCDRDSLSFDHVVPLARGGHHVESNIAPAHFGCNSRKRAA